MQRLQYAPCDGLTDVLGVGDPVKLIVNDCVRVTLGGAVSDDVTLAVIVLVRVVDGVLVVVDAIPVSV